jgi:hypothetical protein
MDRRPPLECGPYMSLRQCTSLLPRDAATSMVCSSTKAGSPLSLRPLVSPSVGSTSGA